MTVAVVLAGGIGSRMGGDKPKQFMLLDGRCVIEYSIDAFDRNKGIDEVLVVAHPLWVDFMSQMASRNKWSKVGRIVPGGSERYLSSVNALEACLGYPDDTNMIFHDAARPWIADSLIDDVVKALDNHVAVGVAVPSTDTVWEVVADEAGISKRVVADIPDRCKMWRAQTPQAFRLSVIREAYRKALADPLFASTDDCGVVKRYLPDVEIYVVPGDERNKKITFAGDL